MSSPVTTLLESAGLLADNLMTTRKSLPEPVRLLHRRTLLALRQVGEPPAREELQDWADDLHIDLDASLHQLAEAGWCCWALRARDHGRGPVRGPPTAHRVCIHDGPTVFANCAVDALGPCPRLPAHPRPGRCRPHAVRRDPSRNARLRRPPAPASRPDLT